MATTTCTFTVSSTEPLDYRPQIATALPLGILHMVKEYAGDVTGHSGTGELTGITGAVALTIDPDGTHHFTFDYDL